MGTAPSPRPFGGAAQIKAHSLKKRGKIRWFGARLYHLFSGVSRRPCVIAYGALRQSKCVFPPGLVGRGRVQQSSYWAQHGIDVQQPKQPNQSMMFSPISSVFGTIKEAF
ncbi:hypothetical protein [Primorskyibacter marinus]|uniref:hypothetical protein n=1 Tax=Primorskyibacter marinus TaxID=1977320 RepID=UPI0013009C8F|nr:hypothetical protein [Primorskyibacter marinus]